jgi:hypothetical protein
MRNLGLMGESTFSLWCADAGLIPNGSIVDKTGWDFFVEFPFDNILVQTIHDAAKECKVQVKATDKKERKLQFTLSNLRRLVTTPLPTFILFLEFNKQSQAEDAFLVHIDDKLSTQILRKIYELSAANNDVPLNKKSMIIHYNESHRITPLNGHALKEVLNKHIGDNFDSYIKHKKAHIAKTGYENGSVRMGFSTNGKENLEKMIDSSLGMNVKFSVNGLTHNNMRFDIIDDNNHVEPQDGIMQFQDVKPFSTCKLSIAKDKFSTPIIFDCNLYVSTINHIIPNEFKKFRIENDLFDFVFKMHACDANYTFYFEKLINFNLIKTKKALSLYKLIKSHGKRVALNIKFENGKNIDITLNCLDEEFDLSHELKAAEDLLEITRLFEFTDDISISLDDLHLKSESIQLTHKSLLKQIPLNDIKVQLNVVDIDNIQNKVAALFFMILHINEYYFCAVISFFGTPRNIQDNTFELELTDYDICRKFVKTELNKDEINALLIELADTFDDSYTVVVNGLDEANK